MQNKNIEITLLLFSILTFAIIASVIVFNYNDSDDQFSILYINAQTDDKEEEDSKDKDKKTETNKLEIDDNDSWTNIERKTVSGRCSR